MWKNDSGKVDWPGLAVAVVGAIWIMLVIGSIWESCTLF